MKKPLPISPILALSAIFIAILLIFYPLNIPFHFLLPSGSRVIKISSSGTPLLLHEEAFLLFNSKKITHSLMLDTIAHTPARKTTITLTGIDAEEGADKAFSPIEKLTNQKREEIFRTYGDTPKPFTATVTKNLLDELGIPLGGGFQIGRAKFIATDVIKSADTKTMRVFVSTYAFRATHLLGPASNVQYIYTITLPEGISAKVWKQNIHTRYPTAKWQISYPE